MALRPNPSTGSPGRTYKWYTGTPVFEFGFGLHYTTFEVLWASLIEHPQGEYNIQDLVNTANATGGHVDAALLDTFDVDVTNTGLTSSDYVVLLFANTTAGPSPPPLKELASYVRVHSLAPGHTTTISLNVTLGTIARVDGNGNSVLEPGTYKVWVDTTREIVRSFRLTGNSEQITMWPQPPS